jgi:hypothetical protein
MAQLMIAEVYDALKEAGASEEKSRKAAEAVASYENRFTEIDRKFETRFNAIERRLDVLTWMVGFNLTFTLGLLWKAFS